MGREGSAEVGNWKWKEMGKEREGRGGRGEREKSGGWIRNHNTEGMHE